jgi:hypothetical protein
VLRSRRGSSYSRKSASSRRDNTFRVVGIALDSAGMLYALERNWSDSVRCIGRETAYGLAPPAT